MQRGEHKKQSQSDALHSEIVQHQKASDVNERKKHGTFSNTFSFIYESSLIRNECPMCISVGFFCCKNEFLPFKNETILWQHWKCETKQHTHIRTQMLYLPHPHTHTKDVVCLCYFICFSVCCLLLKTPILWSLIWRCSCYLVMVMTTTTTIIMAVVMVFSFGISCSIFFSLRFFGGKRNSAVVKKHIDS